MFGINYCRANARGSNERVKHDAAVMNALVRASIKVRALGSSKMRGAMNATVKKPTKLATCKIASTTSRVSDAIQASPDFAIKTGLALKPVKTATASDTKAAPIASRATTNVAGDAVAGVQKRAVTKRAVTGAVSKVPPRMSNSASI